MKNKHFFLLSVVSLVALLTFNRCNLDGSCYQQYEVPVFRLELPDLAPVNTKIEGKAIYVNYNDCQIFNNTSTVTEGDTMSIHVICFIKDCSCPETLPDSIAAFNFTGKVAGTYYFRMWKFDNTILQDSVVFY